MKKLLFAGTFVVFLITATSAQDARDSIQYKTEVGMNFRTPVSVFLGSSPVAPEFNVHLKTRTRNGHAMRYNLNFIRENPFLAGHRGDVVSLTPSQKVEINPSQEANTLMLGVGWEYRSRINQRMHFYFGGDGLIGVRREQVTITQNTYNVKADSVPVLFSRYHSVPDYVLQSSDVIEHQVTESLLFGLRGTAGIIWEVTDRFWFTTAMEAKFVMRYDETTVEDPTTGKTGKSTGGGNELENRLISDLSLFYRF